MKFLSYDGSIMSFLSKVADLAILNALTLVFSLPLITMGAAVTAAHYTALKIRREEGHVISSFWKSFKANLKQSTGIWLIFVAYGYLAVTSYNISIQMQGKIATVVQVVIASTLILTALVYAWIMPLQSKFINTVRVTFKNSLFMSMKHIWRTILMAIFNVIPVGTLVLILLVLRLRGMGLWLLFGISVPIYWCAILYDKIFEKFEEEITGYSRNDLAQM